MKTKIAILLTAFLFGACKKETIKPAEPFYYVKILVNSPHKNNTLYGAIKIGNEDSNTARFTKSFDNHFKMDTVIKGDGINSLTCMFACVNNGVLDSSNIIKVSVIGAGINFNKINWSINK